VTRRKLPASSSRAIPARHLDAHGRHYSTLRLTDRISPRTRVLFVGINPGVQSALTGHHFAGFSNRFWKLLFESGLVPERISSVDDGRLPEWGFGVTNLVARPTPGIDTIRREEYADGLTILRRKVRRLKPQVVALLGVTLYRVMFQVPARVTIQVGPQEATLEGATVYVLPNPSGRNANFSWAELLAAYTDLTRFLIGTASRQS
jgi:TDG/mug DNA glycosylase family protein